VHFRHRHLATLKHNVSAKARQWSSGANITIARISMSVEKLPRPATMDSVFPLKNVIPDIYD